MRKLIAIFIVCSVILYGVMLCYAEDEGSRRKDLPLASIYERKEVKGELDGFFAEAESNIIKQQLNLDILSSLYYLGYDYRGIFDSSSLDKAMNWSGAVDAAAPIYDSEVYKGYYKARTEKPMEKYSDLKAFDFTEFSKTARQEYDSYIKSTIKNEADRTRLIILLQERLLDKLPELIPAERSKALNEILSLRQPSKAALCNDYIYQVLESRVRVEVLAQMQDMNRDRLIELASKTAVSITADKGGSLLIKCKAPKMEEEMLQILNTSTEEGKFSGYIILYELYGNKNGSFLFTDSSGREYSIEMIKVIQALDLDGHGHLQLKLSDLLKNEGAEGTEAGAIQQEAAAKGPNPAIALAALQASYNSRSMEARKIIKELNRYSIYMDLKNRKIQNSFTKGFEAQQKQWKESLEASLLSFGPGGAADFAAFIKQYVLLDRDELGRTEAGKAITAKFRNSVVQFRQPDESSLWITDILYNIKYSDN